MKEWTKKKLIADCDQTFISLLPTSRWRFQGDVQGFLQTLPSLYGTHLDCSSRFYSPIRINTGSDKTPYIWTARLHHSAISNPIIYWPDCAKNHISNHSKPFRYAHPGCQRISR